MGNLYGVRRHRFRSAGALRICRIVEQRAAQTLKWVSDYGRDVLSPSLDHLTLGRAALYAALLEGNACRPQPPAPYRGEDTARGPAIGRRELDAAVDGLRRAGNLNHLPRALLTRAWCLLAEGAAHKLLGQQTQATDCEKRAKSHLEEAWEIAERGPMPLLLADIRLHRARLFGRMKEEGRRMKEEPAYPWESPQADLAEARRLIYKHGYLRRKEELEDAEEAFKLGGDNAR